MKTISGELNFRRMVGRWTRFGLLFLPLIFAILIMSGFLALIYAKSSPIPPKTQPNTLVRASLTAVMKKPASVSVQLKVPHNSGPHASSVAAQVHYGTATAVISSITPISTSTITQAVGAGTIAYSDATNRYFPIGTSAVTMKLEAAALTKQQVKDLIEHQVDLNWSIIQTTFGFPTKAQAYAFFLGMATRESTLNASLETGSGASHSYGPIQASEDAYAGANPDYSPENDVPQMYQYAFTPQNYYDPAIAVHMGIRHLIHFAHQARAAGFSGIQLLRHALIGYNTGSVQESDPNWMQQYSDEIGALSGWYLLHGHLYDTAFTWTSDPEVDRSQPWGWY